MRKLFYLLICCLIANLAIGQAGDGDLSPNFTATDINGVEHSLYDVLDEGKTVILDFIGIFCGPCWRDHESGKLKNFYNEFGPDGTDEVVVFMIESDPNSNLSDLRGENGVGLGDWITGTPYPIFNDHEIISLYQVFGFPRYYKICPERKIEQIFLGLMEQEDFPPLIESCTPLEGQSNLGLHGFNNLQDEVCGNITNIDLEAILQNTGVDEITSAELTLFINEEPYESKTWTGSLDPYYFDFLKFDQAPIGGITSFEIRVTEVNGQEDNFTLDNSISTEFRQSTATDHQQLILHLDTDEKGEETYWQLWSDGGDLLEIRFAGEYERDSNYYILLDLPVADCYDFILYDSNSDGLSTHGKAEIFDLKGNLLVEIGTGFGFFETRSIELTDNKVEPLAASLVNLENVPQDFCGSIAVAPKFNLFNLGTSEITTAVIAMEINGQTVQTINWEGALDRANQEEIIFDPTEVDFDAEIEIKLQSINGEETLGNFQNSLRAETKMIEAEQTLVLDLEMDQYACEIFWQFYSASTGEVIASGGNPNAVPGPNLELVVQHVNCDGTYYEDNETYQELIEIPNDDCYVFEIIDNYGDGLSFGGSWSLSNFDGTVIVDGQQQFSKIEHHITGSETVSVVDQPIKQDLKISPNPGSGMVQISGLPSSIIEAELFVYHSSGKLMDKESISGASHDPSGLRYDFSHYTSGIYLIKVAFEDEIHFGKFVLVK